MKTGTDTSVFRKLIDKEYRGGRQMNTAQKVQLRELTQNDTEDRYPRVS